MVVEATITYAKDGKIHKEVFAGTEEKWARQSAWKYARNIGATGYRIDAAILENAQERAA